MGGGGGGGFFQAEDGIRDLVRSRGLGDVYKRQVRKTALALEKKFRAESDIVDIDTSVEADAPREILSLIHI